MKTRTLLVVVALFVLSAGLLAMTACSPKEPVAEPPVSETPTEAPPSDGAAGMRLANGLYDIEDGKVQAIGNLAYRDLEGGFWAVVGGVGEDAEDDTIVVIANGSEFAEELKALEGKLVNVIGTRADGASIRMAGPEMNMESIEEMSDTPGIAE